MANDEIERLKRRLSELEGDAVGKGKSLRAGEADRGRLASRPTELPAAGWMDILKRSWGEISEANLFLVSGGVTYSVLLALFPGLAALGPVSS
jgi:membrane protein